MNITWLIFSLLIFVPKSIAQHIEIATLPDSIRQNLDYICSNVYEKLGYRSPMSSYSEKLDFGTKHKHANEQYTFNIQLPGQPKQEPFDIRTMDTKWILKEYNKRYNVQESSLDRFIGWGLSAGKKLIVGSPLLAQIPPLIPKLGIHQALITGSLFGIPYGLWALSLIASSFLWNRYENSCRKRYEKANNENDIIRYANSILGEISRADLLRRLEIETKETDSFREIHLKNLTAATVTAANQIKKTDEATKSLGTKTKTLLALLDGEEGHIKKLIETMTSSIKNFLDKRMEENKNKREQRTRRDLDSRNCFLSASCSASSVSGSPSSISSNLTARLLNPWNVSYLESDQFDEKTITSLSWFIPTNIAHLPSDQRALWCNKCNNSGSCEGECRNTELVCIKLPSRTIVQRRTTEYETVSWSDEDPSKNKGLCKSCKNTGKAVVGFFVQKTIQCNKCNGLIFSKSAGGHQIWSTPEHLKKLPTN